LCVIYAHIAFEHFVPQQRPGSDGSPVRRKTRNGGQAAAEDVVSQMERRMAELEGHLLTGCPNTVH